jgi:hypothetical protein
LARTGNSSGRDADVVTLLLLTKRGDVVVVLLLVGRGLNAEAYCWLAAQSSNPKVGARSACILMVARKDCRL